MHSSPQKILADLIAFPSISKKGNIEIIEYIRQYLQALKVESTIVAGMEPDKFCLHARIGPKTDGGVVLSGHTDVVPVEGQNWTTNPFELVEQGDKLYGRGTCDMKGFLACMLAAVPALKKAKLKKPVYLAFTYDEEVGCVSGQFLANKIKTHYQEKIPYAIVGEPSMLKAIFGHKSISVFRIIISGSAGHSSRIKTEVSAIHEAAKLIVWLENYMNNLIDLGKIDDRFTPNHTSLHVGQIHGGIADNVIADKAWFSLDIRTIPSDDLNKIIEDIRLHFDSVKQKLRTIYPDADIQMTAVYPSVPSFDTEADSPAYDLAEALTGTRTSQTAAYAAEAGQYKLEGYHTIICGPGSIAQAHRANEFISKEQLQLGYKMLTEQLVDFLNQS